MKAETLKRKTWNSEDVSGWDDALSEETILNGFKKKVEMTEIEFTRCIRPYQSVGDPILVIFRDASKEIQMRQLPTLYGLSRTGLMKLGYLLLKTHWPRKANIYCTTGIFCLSSCFQFLLKHSSVILKGVKSFRDSEVVRAMIQKDSMGLTLLL